MPQKKHKPEESRQAHAGENEQDVERFTMAIQASRCERLLPAPCVRVVRMFAVGLVCQSYYGLKATLISDGTCSRHPLFSGGRCPVTRDCETTDQRDDHRTHRQRVDLRGSAALVGRIVIVDQPGGRLSVKREGGKPKHSDDGGGWRPPLSGVGFCGSSLMLKGARSAPQRADRR
jgi:hypothetical protein